MKKPKPETKTTDQELADLMLKRDAEKKARVERVGNELGALLQKERCILVGIPQIDKDGKIVAQIQLQALD